MSDPTAPSSLPPEPNPAPAAPPVAPQPTASSTAAADSATAPAGTGLAPNVAAGLACLFPLFGGIAFLILEKKNQFVRFYAMQSVIFGAFCFAFWIAVMILIKIPFLGWLIGLLSLIVWLGILVVGLITVINAFTGKEWEIPIIGKMAREQLAKMPTAP